MTDRERALTPWDPFADFEALTRFPFRTPRTLETMWGPRGTAFPAMDISEDEEAYILTAELPGCRKEDVTIEVHDGTLSVRGEKRSEREEKNEQRRHVERSFGSFSRSFKLPPDADEHQVAAGFAEGVLTVRIRRTEEVKPRTVDIKSG